MTTSRQYNYRVDRAYQPMEARYTVTLDELLSDPDFDLFDFDYGFYEPELKCQFEWKFIEHYRFREIGFESVARFKQFLMRRLNEGNVMWRQIYLTELAVKELNIQFMLNKDLHETFVREVVGEGEGSANSKTTTDSNAHAENKTDSEHWESSLANGNATVDDPTGVSKDTNKGQVNSNDKSTGVGETTSKTLSKNLEKTDLLSQGNIGITSSGALLTDWRSILINLDLDIIDSLADLFMGVY